VYHYEGAPFSAVHNLANILQCSFEAIYSTNYANSLFIFSHYHKKRMMVEKIVVKSLQTAISGNVPIGSGLIFVSDNPTMFSFIDEFRYMSIE